MRVPTPGLFLATYAVVVAIVIALALTLPSASVATPSSPYPVQRPVKTKIIQNCRLFLNAMLALGVVGLIFFLWCARHSDGRTMDSENA
ncbi:hypothetical protein GA0061084_0613 [Arthrobacter sp. NIO-1057]|nr:hypothetical protein GA0061084_0613 [Arthrobacter sp. NIO-1057]